MTSKKKGEVKKPDVLYASSCTLLGKDNEAKLVVTPGDSWGFKITFLEPGLSEDECSWDSFTLDQLEALWAWIASIGD